MWITYPGDFEIWLGNKFNNRRTERGAMFPPFWKQDSHYVTVEFSTTVNLEEAEEVEILCEGKFNLMLDGKLQFGMPEHFTVPAGEHKLNLKVWNQSTPPALYIKGKTIVTDSSWLATYEDKIWIDENGVAHGSGIYVPAATSKYFLNKGAASFRVRFGNRANDAGEQGESGRGIPLRLWQGDNGTSVRRQCKGQRTCRGLLR